MSETIEFQELTLTPVKLKFTEEELKKKITFKGAISSEHLKGQDFHYYLMPKRDLEELLKKTGWTTSMDDQKLYHITGFLVTSTLKHESVNGYYIPTQWGFVQVQVFD